MKNIVEAIISLTILFITVGSCSNETDKTYEEGLKKCREKVAQYQIKHPNTPAFSAREDIIGYKIPELNTQTIAGQKIDQEYFKGKFGIINFWFEGCPPCVKEIPDLNGLVDKFVGSQYAGMSAILTFAWSTDRNVLVNTVRNQVVNGVLNLHKC